MCGRYVQSRWSRKRAEQITPRLPLKEAQPETWNLAPSTASLVVRNEAEGLTGVWLTRGLEGSGGELRPLNARIESASTKFTFRDAWKERRCLIPIDGWYEWQTIGKRKQPYFFRRRDNSVILLAGLWTSDSFCLITTDADGDLGQVHDRRPLTMRDDLAEGWILDPPMTPQIAVARAIPPTDIVFHPVSPRVGNPRNDGPELIAPLPPLDQKLLFEPI